MSGIDYCKNSESAIVTYWFKGKKKRRVKINSSTGINVSVKAENVPIFKKTGSSGMAVPDCPGTMEVFLIGVAFTAPNYPNCPYEFGEFPLGQIEEGKTLTINTRPVIDGCKNGLWVDIPEIGFTSERFGGQWKEPQGFKYVCGRAGCKLVVNGRLLDVSGKDKPCPVKYEVACGEDCAEGYVKCPKPTYPGYCCLPCKSTANKVNKLGNKLK
ncbi:MAG: hypothetical protein WBB28_24955 [Crinalium sp.]